MASGLGIFHSSNYLATTSSTGIKCTAQVSLVVDTTARTARIVVDAMMSFHRISGNWNISNGTDITYDNNDTYYVYGSLDGQSQTAYKLGIVGASSYTATAGTTYCQVQGPTSSTRYIKSRSGYNSLVTVDRTFNFDNSGAAISKGWEARVYYRGTTLYLSGTVTTDPITPVVNKTKLYGSVNGRARQVRKLYCSVNNQAKKIKKLYAGDAGGNAKLIYEDNS